ncbi:hypothetical protein M407DRAFT_6441 [Tulasnella calospora MUT 4182]|uniref:Uncharacterized protein n=1 Tax=Tulasnella calospora MUT 4182 TaxID=1051891 RepID=A0A0C3L5K2_9AGAM|nr:hypothetical protein M407DRAFT_6441 [Tulasnella calospora MUT 4182]
MGCGLDRLGVSGKVLDAFMCAHRGVARPAVPFPWTSDLGLKSLWSVEGHFIKRRRSEQVVLGGESVGEFWCGDKVLTGGTTEPVDRVEKFLVALRYLLAMSLALTSTAAEGRERRGLLSFRSGEGVVDDIPAEATMSQWGQWKVAVPKKSLDFTLRPKIPSSQMFGDSILHPKYYLYCSQSHPSSSSSAPSSPASSSTALVPASSPSSPSYASLMLVAYPQQQQQPTMYVAAQPTYYYAQTTAGQWTPVQTVAQAGNVSNGAYVLQQPQQIRTQAPTTTSAQPTFIAVPQAQQVATRQPQVATRQPQVYTQQAPHGQVAYRAGPPTISVPTVRPGLQRKHSSASMHGRRDSFDSQDSRSGMFTDREEYNRAPSPVFSEATSSSSGSSSSSSSSHLNLSRSALNHYLAPQKTRPRRESIIRRGSYDLPGPVTSRPPMGLPAPGPQQAMVPMHPQPTRSATYPPPSGMAPQQMAVEPAFVRPADLSGRPVSFHEDQNPVYSSYELYNAQRNSPSASRPPTIRPTLARRASSRSLGGAGELSASAYGSGFSMGGGPGMGLMGGGYDNGDDKRKWWKR